MRKINSKFTVLFQAVLKSKALLPIIGVFTILSFAFSPLFYGVSHAYGDPSDRSIQMSSDVAGATGVTYQVSLTPSATGTIDGIVVDFCSFDPIIGDTCSAPSGFDISTATLTVNPGGPDYTGGTWSLTPLTSGGMEAVAVTSSTTTSYISGPITFTIGGITNPTAPNQSFFGRLLTYASSSDATSYTSTSIGTPLDAGGTAITTGNTVVITSRVQEEITFCVYTSNLCVDSGVNLGDTDDVLSALGPYVDTSTLYEIQTNASQGAVITMQGNTLQSGSNYIESSSVSGMGSVAGNDYASNPGSNQFGLCTTVDGGITITPIYPYDNSSCGNATQTAGTGTTGGTNSAMFAFNITNATSTFGDVIATVTPGDYSTGKIDFVANTAINTIAGIYSTTLDFIATGTY